VNYTRLGLFVSWIIVMVDKPCLFVCMSVCIGKVATFSYTLGVATVVVMVDQVG